MKHKLKRKANKKLWNKGLQIKDISINSSQNRKGQSLT